MNMLNGAPREVPLLAILHSIASWHHSPIIRWIAFVTLVLLAFVCLVVLVDTSYLYVFEADASAHVAEARAFAEVPVTQLPVPGVYPPYFDGLNWIYAAGYLIAKLARTIGLLDAARFPTSESLAIFAVRSVNLLAQVGSVALVFLTVAKLGGSTLLALLLSLIFLFDPQLLGIDLLRVDRVILFLFILVFSFSLEVNHGRQQLLLDVALGVSAAALVMTKITSVVFLVVPAFAYLHQRIALKAPLRHVSAFLVSLAVASALIAIRYLMLGWRDAGLLARTLFDKLSMVVEWYAVMSREPYLYYNWDVFLPLGGTFMAIFLLALAGCFWGLVCRKSADAGLVLFPLAVLSLLGIPAFKYERGGYVLIPLYLYVITYGVWVLRDELTRVFPRGRMGLCISGIVIAAVLFFPLHHAWNAYQRTRLEFSARGESIRLTRIVPREWFVKNVPATTRVAIFINSEWADPPIFDLGYDFSPALLNFPYLDADKMGRFLPPAPDTLLQIADVIVLNSFHRYTYTALMKKYGHDKVAVEWERFFDELYRRFPHLQFKAPSPNYGVDQVDIIVLNPSLLAR